MFIKIAYKPTACAIFNDVENIYFESNVSSDAVIEHTIVEDGKSETRTFDESVTNVLICPEYLESSVGACPIGDTDKEYALNSLQFTLKSTSEKKHVVYTGSAYLCDDTGKTIDVLR